MYATAALMLLWTLQAARYQMIVMFLVSSNSGLCSVATVYGAAATVIDSEHRLRLERLSAKQPRDARMAGAAQWVWAAVCTEPCRQTVPAAWTATASALAVQKWLLAKLFLHSRSGMACLAQGLGMVRRSQHVAGTSLRGGPRMVLCRRRMRTQQTSKRACH